MLPMLVSISATSALMAAGIGYVQGDRMRGRERALQYLAVGFVAHGADHAVAGQQGLLGKGAANPLLTPVMRRKREGA